MATTNTDYSRLEARIPAEIHQLVKHAAKLEGRSMTDFVIKAISDAAKQTIRDNNIVNLSLSDQRRFAEILLEPATMTQAMAEALALHEQMTASE